MGSTQVFTEEDISRVKRVLFDNYGNIRAAHRDLKCGRSTLQRFIKKHDLEEYLSDCREDGIDYAESMLFENIGNHREKSIIFYLSTQGKHRGYTKKSEQDVNVKTAVPVKVLKDVSMDDI